jgi:capsular polysaccharide biosynthesis protein
MEQFDNEVELIEYFNVLWKRRWLIIVPTILLALIAGIVSFVIPPKWEIDAIIQPGKYFVQSPPGTFTEVVGMDPKKLVGQINQGSYIRLTSAELNLDPGTFPKVKAENLRDTNLVRVSLRTGETDKARAILNALFQHIKSDLDTKIDIEMKSISTEIVARENDITAKSLDIQSNNIDIEKARQEMISAGKKLKISEDRSRSLVDEIDKQQQTTLGLLLYFNQEDLRLFIRVKEQEIKSLKSQIARINQEIAGIRNQIELLMEIRQRIDYTQLVKEPTVSPSPVSPRKKVNVAIAGFLGLFCFSILALFLDYIEKRNIRLKTGS